MSSINELEQMHERTEEARATYGAGSNELRAMETQRDEAVVNADLSGVSREDIARAVHVDAEGVDRILRGEPL